MTRAIVSIRTKDSFWHPLWDRYYRPHFHHVEVIHVGSSYSLPFSKMTELLNKAIDNLMETFDQVVCADTDEFLVPDPDKYRDLGDYLDQNNEQVVRCVGYDVMEMLNQKPVDIDRMVTESRTMWTRNMTYDKPVIMRRKITYTAGQHYCNCPTVQDKDLYMLHMRYADIKSLLMRRSRIDLKSLTDEQRRAEPIPEKWRVI